jgi:peptidoglycan hydrolase-like protein with peptidoglycan-binding domain
MDMGKSGIRQLPGQNAGYLFSGSTVSQPGAGSIGSATIYKTPSLTNGFSFGINMEANKMINKRTGFSISLGYQMYQSQIGIGNRIDSATFISSSNSSNDDGFYYLSTDERKYTNRYHFIQTGFSFYVDRVVAKIIPIRWHIGTGASFLLSSNALHYDAAKGILFRSRPLVNNFQLNLSAGFDMGIGKKPFFYIGPELTYFITHPSQHPGSTDQYLFRAGARAVYILPKKKK